MADAPDFVVDRTDLRRCAFVPGRHSPATPLDAGQVLVRVDRFGLTANNVTYGAAGDLMGYWGFFPADAGWGRIPVWGFGDVAASRHPGIAAGERLYGYFPMSTHVVLQADRVTLASFVDAAAHRAALPPFYNQYTRVAADPGYAREREGEIAIFRPLFATGFLLDAFLAGESFFGGRDVVLSSASSKTALALAFLLSSTRRDACTVTGLTSAGHAAFVRGTGYYTRVVTYDDLGSLSSDTPSVFVDFAGNARVVAAVHTRLGSALRHSAQVGVTHWDRMGATGDLPGPAPVFFFAPDHLQRQVASLGGAAFAARVGAAMQRFLASTASWLRLVERRGTAAVEAAYRAAVDGRTNPAEGHILSL
jgi:hypothetical protein